jgi:hypothetical protein
MRTLPVTASDDDLLSAVREWVGLLAAERYEEAFDYLYHTDDEHWTPQLMETVIHNYGSIDRRRDGRTFRVTTLDTATGEAPLTHTVERYDSDPVRGEVWFDLPLNGEWSDLTATVDFHQHGDVLMLQLNDIHVM